MTKEEIEAKLEFSDYVKYTLELEGKVKELEEENRKLKEKYNGLWGIYTADVKERVEENHKLKKNIERYEKEETRYINKIKNLEMIKKENESQISCYFKERDKLREKNQTLKDNVEFLHSCLDDRDKSIEIMKSELDKFSEAYKRYRDYEKEELAESCYCFARENEKLKEEIKGLRDKQYTHGEPVISSGTCL